MTRFRTLFALLAMALLAAACGGSEEPAAVTGEPTTTVAPETTEAMDDDAMEDEAMEDEAMDADADEEVMDEVAEGFPVDVAGVTVPDRPERIVSISPSATEMLFAMGAGDQVVAVDSFSYYPEEAPVTDLSAFEPNLEAIAAFEPDLVVASFDPDGMLAAGFGELGVPVLVQFAAFSLEDAFGQMTNLGVATGNEDGATELVDSMRADIDAILATLPDEGEPVRVYHELDPTFFSVTSATFLGELYTLVGVENIADPADADGSAFGYPQLSAEYILEADPELIVFTDAYDESADDVAARPGFESTTAAQNGQIIQVDDDVASRWGPRVVDFLELVVKAVNDARA